MIPCCGIGSERVGIDGIGSNSSDCRGIGIDGVGKPCLVAGGEAGGRWALKERFALAGKPVLQPRLFTAVDAVEAGNAT